MIPKKVKQPFGLVMASDEKYTTYLKTAIRSIRKLNSHLPIHVYSCSNIKNITDQGDQYCQIKKVKVPQDLKESLGATSELEHSLTRIAKLESMSDENFNSLMYIDSDILALEDVDKITTELEVGDSNKPVVYLLLRRPGRLSITDISWLYFKDSSQLSAQQMADLVNNTFETNYSAERLLNIRCWNGGIIYGSSDGIRILAGLWKKFYLQMLTGKNKNSFIPNDQLCLWLAIDQLENELTVRELPLAWNFMPGHALEEIMKKTNPSPQEIRESLAGVKILHLAQNKTDVWAQILINEVNSNTNL
ncbi:MAG: glycosyltransferase [Candidatus Shapirobacteria bacterium]|jgi:hypothetical protein